MLAFIVWWLSAPYDLTPWRAGAPPPGWAAWQRQEEVWRHEGSHRRPEHTYVPLSEISEQLQAAVLVGEDIGFLSHGAVDPRAILEALQEWREGRRLRGASTISQQLAKILFLSNERTLGRKLSEARLAWWLERSLGKRRILELYLNVVEFGPGLLGAEAASQHYFRVSASALDAGQAAGLAAAIPAPGRDNPTTATARWESRKRIILVRLEHVDWLRQRLRALDRAPATPPTPGTESP